MVINKNLKIFLSKYQENKFSHAILIETNNINQCLNDISEIIKHILCKKQAENCLYDCNICNLIDSGNLPSLRIIETEDSAIKKEQITELKKAFQSESIYSDFNIYIIKNAERLTKASANTMLKFLEEPDGQVIGFFVTENKEKILETIRSRCQSYTAIYKTDNLNEEFALSAEDYEKHLALLRNYVKLLETNLDECLLKNKKLVLDSLKERVQVEKFFKILFKIYNSYLNQQTEDYREFDFITKNCLKTLTKKLQIISKTTDKLQYNPNLELLLDKFIIEMREIND